MSVCQTPLISGWSGEALCPPQSFTAEDHPRGSDAKHFDTAGIRVASPTGAMVPLTPPAGRITFDQTRMGLLARITWHSAPPGGDARITLHRTYFVWYVLGIAMKWAGRRCLHVSARLLCTVLTACSPSCMPLSRSSRRNPTTNWQWRAKARRS